MEIHLNKFKVQTALSPRYVYLYQNKLFKIYMPTFIYLRQLLIIRQIAMGDLNEEESSCDYANYPCPITVETWLTSIKKWFFNHLWNLSTINITNDIHARTSFKLHFLWILPECRCHIFGTCEAQYNWMKLLHWFLWKKKSLSKVCDAFFWLDENIIFPIYWYSKWILWLYRMYNS